MEDVTGLKNKLEAHLRTRFPERRDLSVSQLSRISGGFSNVSYVYTANWQGPLGADSETLVVRMLPEMGPVPPYDIRPQYEVNSRVYGGGVPLPKVHWLELDKSVLGHACFAMEKIEGEPMMDARGRDPAQAATLLEEYVRILANIHALDWKACGLSVLGVPGNDRQHAETEIEKWESAFHKNQYGPQPVLAEVFGWLKKNIPKARRTTLCHGDYQQSNLFCNGGHIVAVFDWELTAIGDPMSDVAWVCMFNDVLRLGQFDEKDFLKRYQEASGTKLDESSLLFWKLLAYARLSAMAFGALRTGIETKNFEVHQVGVHSVLLRRQFKAMADVLGF